MRRCSTPAALLSLSTNTVDLLVVWLQPFFFSPYYFVVVVVLKYRAQTSTSWLFANILL